MGRTDLQHHNTAWYLSKSRGWVTEQLPDTVLRMTCRATTQSISDVHNELKRPNPRGGWMDVDERELSGMERGLVFAVKPRQGTEQSFIEVSSYRFVDEYMGRTLLDGLTLHDSELKPMANPETAVNRFCIPTLQADTFYQRVRSAGGVLSEAQADLQGMYNALNKLYGLTQELGKLCEISRGVVDKIAAGNQTEAPSISERSKTAHYIKEQAVEILKQIRDEQLALERTPGQVEHKGYGAAYLKKAEELMSQVEMLYTEHRSYEKQAALRVQEEMLADLPSGDGPAVSRRYLMMPVVEYYTERGLDCRLTEDGMMVQLENGVLELGAVPKFHPRDNGNGAARADNPSGMDPLLGRPTAERGKRTL